MTQLIRADLKSFFNATTDIHCVIFKKNDIKSEKDDTMYADLLSEKITDIVTADIKSGSRNSFIISFTFQNPKINLTFFD
jgi:hypothetical protein